MSPDADLQCQPVKYRSRSPVLPFLASETLDTSIPSGSDETKVETVVPMAPLLNVALRPQPGLARMKYRSPVVSSIAAGDWLWPVGLGWTCLPVASLQ